jgi:hypothetical protein
MILSILRSNYFYKFRKKFELTRKFLQEKESQKKIHHMNEMQKLEEITGKQVFTDVCEDNHKSSIISQPNQNDIDNFEQKTQEFKDRNLARIKQKSLNLIKMIEDISDDEYEDVNDTEVKLSKNLINKNNLNRIIRVRNIMKNKIDDRNDNLGMANIDKFKEERRVNDNELMKTLNKLGPPSFLKTRFKKETIDRYKMVNGKFFGCFV